MSNRWKFAYSTLPAPRQQVNGEPGLGAGVRLVVGGPPTAARPPTPGGSMLPMVALGIRWWSSNSLRCAEASFVKAKKALPNSSVALAIDLGVASRSHVPELVEVGELGEHPGAGEKVQDAGVEVRVA